MRSMSSRDIWVHDMFNLFSLSIIIAVDLIYLVRTTDMNSSGISEFGVGHEDLFNTFFHLFFWYTVIDTIWILLNPTCIISNPYGIVIHHIMVIFLCAVPYFERRFAWTMVNSKQLHYLTYTNNITPLVKYATIGLLLNIRDQYIYDSLEATITHWYLVLPSH